MIHFDCPNCGRTIKVKDEWAGRKGKCTVCGRVIQLPKPASGKTIEVTEADIQKHPRTAKSQDEVSDRWFLKTEDGQDYGPVAKAELDQWLKEGLVTQKCRIWREGVSQWRPAKEIYPELQTEDACGQSIEAPTLVASDAGDEEPQGLSRKTLTVLWACAATFALVSLSFLVWHSNATRKQKANQRLSEATAAATEWLSAEIPTNGEAIEKELADALAVVDGTHKNDGKAVLNQVHARLEQVERENRIKAYQQQATALLRDAEKRIESKHLAEAIELLREYLSHPHASEKSEAERLVAEVETAISDTIALDALVSMSDEEFDRAKTANTIEDGKVTHPVLLAVRKETVQRNLDKATQRRNEIKSAEEARQKAEQLAAMKRKREEERKRLQEEERKRAEEAAARKDDPVVVFLPPAPSREGSEVEVKTDRFSGTRSVHMRAVDLTITNQRPVFRDEAEFREVSMWGFFYEGGKPEVNLFFNVSARSWVNLRLFSEVSPESNRLTLLLDGRRLSRNFRYRTSLITDTTLVMETSWLTLDLQDFASLVNAKSVEVQIGLVEFRLNGKAQDALRAWAGYIPRGEHGRYVVKNR